MVSKRKRVGEKVVERYAASKMSRFISAIRLGWNSYNFIFYIGGISAILGGIFGWAGWVSAIATVAFFYFAGRFTEKVDLEHKRQEEEKAKRKRRSSR